MSMFQRARIKEIEERIKAMDAKVGAKAYVTLDKLAEFPRITLIVAGAVLVIFALLAAK